MTFDVEDVRTLLRLLIKIGQYIEMENREFGGNTISVKSVLILYCPVTTNDTHTN